MEFASNPTLEALIGRVCLVFARVEQAAGHVVASAHGEWALAASAHYLNLSSNSGLLLDWLKAVGVAYPEAKDDLSALRKDLRALKAQRDQWAHSADVVDLFLTMRERGLTAMSARDVKTGKLLNGRAEGHVAAPTAGDADNFVARASDAGDAASDLAIKLAKLADSGVRQIDAPKGSRVQARTKRSSESPSPSP